MVRKGEKGGVQANPETFFFQPGKDVMDPGVIQGVSGSGQADFPHPVLMELGNPLFQGFPGYEIFMCLFVFQEGGMHPAGKTGVHALIREIQFKGEGAGKGFVSAGHAFQDKGFMPDLPLAAKIKAKA